MELIGNLSCERCDKRMLIEWDGQNNTGCILEKNVQELYNLTYQAECGELVVSWLI